MKKIATFAICAVVALLIFAYAENPKLAIAPKTSPSATQTAPAPAKALLTPSEALDKAKREIGALKGYRLSERVEEDAGGNYIITYEKIINMSANPMDMFKQYAVNKETGKVSEMRPFVLK